MDFLKKIFGGNAANVSSANQENFVVDETGNAKEAGSAFVAPVTQNINPVKASDNIPNPVSSPVNTPVSNPASAVTPELIKPAVSQNPVSETAIPSDGEYVGDTSAFDELMKQAESSVDARVLDQPVLDPEFQKAKSELESEGDIEIFPTQ